MRKFEERQDAVDGVHLNIPFEKGFGGNSLVLSGPTVAGRCDRGAVTGGPGQGGGGGRGDRVGLCPQTPPHPTPFMMHRLF